ncbi:kunitz-type protease inhibitor 2 isoform X2 [Rhinatrema bivittatum]|uniref:kunitz-type protease inhibitor 2 isoform X2 n=1 Tax=Rhinatrema bivittatum TaxID=194408 RepID=UPI0011263058|nr:kunitz-type protease inhibitor 2 isoform X2 [Rhinatrema bivittatum]
MAAQVLSLGSFLLLLSLGGEGSSASPEKTRLCPGSGEPLQVQSGMGLEDPLHWAVEMNVISQTEDPADCADACCALPSCNLALLQNNSCYLLNCTYQGHSLCRLGPRDGAISYQKGEAAEQPTKEDFCLARKEVGACRAAFPRWNYDVNTESCLHFIYGGCNGNLNNYLTEEDCIKMCNNFKNAENILAKQSTDDSSYQEYCTVKPETGPCRAAFPRYYYDMEEKICREFIYGGCLGNKNNYLSENSCKDKCIAMVAEPEKIKSDKGVSFQEYCAAPSVTGPCRAAFPRWYYNTSTRTCTKFTYGGCKGNQNNHLSEEECKDRCVAHSDENGGYDPLHPATHHSTTAVALAVLLAVMAAILLGAMVIVFVKMARRNQQESSLATIWSPIDDKEYLMKNAYTL